MMVQHQRDAGSSPAWRTTHDERGKEAVLKGAASLFYILSTNDQ
jgi:hypothetical protein